MKGRSLTLAPEGVTTVAVVVCVSYGRLWWQHSASLTGHFFGVGTQAASLRVLSIKSGRRSLVPYAEDGVGDTRDGPNHSFTLLNFGVVHEGVLLYVY